MQSQAAVAAERLRLENGVMMVRATRVLPLPSFVWLPHAL